MTISDECDLAAVSNHLRESQGCTGIKVQTTTLDRAILQCSIHRSDRAFPINTACCKQSLANVI